VLLAKPVVKQVMGNSAVSKSRRHLDELSGTSLVSQRRFQSVLRDRSDADESGISTSPSCNHSSSYSPTRDLLTAEPAVRIIDSGPLVRRSAIPKVHYSEACVPKLVYKLAGVCYISVTGTNPTLNPK